MARLSCTLWIEETELEMILLIDRSN